MKHKKHKRVRKLMMLALIGAAVLNISATKDSNGKKHKHKDETPKDSIKVDEKIFKKDIRNAILEFCKDTKVNPDSVYIPFKEDKK